MESTGAFSIEQVARLTGLSRRQIDAWDRAGVYQSSLLRRLDRRPFGRIYTFQDVVALRTLAVVRKRVSADTLQRLGEWLKRHGGQPSSQLRFFITPDGDFSYGDQPAEDAERIEVGPIADAADRLLRHLQAHRDKCDIGVIRRNRYVLRNDWAIAGTRIPVWLIQEMSASGSSVQDILGAYPILTDADVRAALAFDLQNALPIAG